MAVILSKEDQDKLKTAIINRLLTDLEGPLTDAITKGLLEKLDLQMIIDEVRSRIPLPQNGKDAQITDELIATIVIKVLDRVQEIHQVKDGRDGTDGDTGPQGLAGKDGRDGVNGQDGRPGLNGQNGLTGPQGERGEKGIQGVRGLPGKDGKDGKQGSSGKDGIDGKDYIISEDDFRAVVNDIDLNKFVDKEELEKILAQLIWDIKAGKIELPIQEGGFGEALANEALIREINRVLGQSDWQNGLPGDGATGGNLNWVNYTDNPTDVPVGAGVVNWNKDELSLDVQTGIGPTLQMGQETYIFIYNDTASPIVNGEVLRPKSATVVGDLVVPTVERAKADVFTTIEGTIMMATMAIPIGEVGLATRFGRVRGINTDGLTPGVNVYVSASVAGGFTTILPEFPNYDIAIGGIIVADEFDGEIFVSVTRQFSDTILNFWNGTFRESFDFLVTSTGGVITGSLSPSNGHPDMTMRLSDGYSMLTATPPATIVLTAGTDTNPQENFVYIPKSTKVLTVSTSDWPTTEHIKIASVVLKTATTTENDGALKNQNWNDHIEDTTTFQGHLSHMTEKLRQFEAQWDTGVQGSITGVPSNVYVSVTSGVIYQLHKQAFPALSMPTVDIDVVNNFAAAYTTTNDLNTQTLDALGNTLANSSFSFVVWGIQNKTGQTSHLMCNLPVGNYSKNTPSNAVSDALNYSVYDIPKIFQGVGFLIARFTLILEADGTTWTLHDTEDLRGKLPNTTAGGGAGGTGVTTWTGLTDTPATFVASQIPRVNPGGTALDFTTLLPSGATQVAAGVTAGQFWRTSGHATLPDNVVLQGV